MKIRRFQLSDAEQIAQLFHNTIRSVNLGDYTEEQLKAWAPDDIHFRDWPASLCPDHPVRGLRPVAGSPYRFFGLDGAASCSAL